MWFQSVKPLAHALQVLVSTIINALGTLKGFRLKELEEWENGVEGVEGDALKLLRGSNQSNLTTEDLHTLAKRLGRLTLALAVSSRILAEGITPKELVRRLDRKGAEAFKREREDPEYRKPPDLVQLFDISMELVKRDSTTEGQLAEAMVKVGGWFASAPIPFHLLGRAAAALSPDLCEEDGAEAFRLLVRFSLGDRERGEDASFHRLVQEYGRFLGGQEAGKAVVSALSKESKSLSTSSAVHFRNICDLTFPGTKPLDLRLEGDERRGVVQNIGIPLVYFYVGSAFQLAQARALNDTFPEDSDRGCTQLAADLAACRGRVLQESGDSRAAYKQYEQALRFQELAALHTSAVCGGCQMSPVKGLMYKSLDQEDFSLCAGCKEKHSPTAPGRFTQVDHPSVAAILNNMALTLGSEDGEAVPLYERSLRIAEEAFGPEHQSVGVALNNMAGLLRSRGKYDEALELYMRDLRISEKALGAEDQRVGVTLNNIAGLLHDRGEYSEALPLYERSLEVLENALGPDHPSVASTLNNMAALLKSQGKEEALGPMYERSLRIKEKALGPEHPSVATTLINLAGLQRSQGNYKEGAWAVRAEPAHFGEGARTRPPGGRDPVEQHGGPAQDSGQVRRGVFYA